MTPTPAVAIPETTRDLEAAGLEAAHEAYERFGQAGGLRTQRLSNGCMSAIIRAYLASSSAAPSGEAEPVVVKALEWHAGRHGNADRADSLIGTYKAWDFDGKNGHFLAPGMVAGRPVRGGLAEAKAEAQNHFEARIRSVLATPTRPASPIEQGEVRAGLLEAARLIDIDYREAKANNVTLTPEYLRLLADGFRSRLDLGIYGPTASPSSPPAEGTAELTERLRGPVFGTPTALQSADVIDKLQADVETWKTRAERLADMHRDMCVVAGEAIARAERAEALTTATAVAVPGMVEVPEGLSKWSGWDQSRMPWSESKHKDEVLEALFRAPWSVEDSAALIGFIDRTWGAASPSAQTDGGRG